MKILEFLFNKNRACAHDRVPPDAELVYCPDCGELIENQWFMARCACCGVKLPTTIRNGVVEPEFHYCHNCGTEEFVVEKLDKISFLNVDFAVLVKTIVTPAVEEKVQSWVDMKSANLSPDLIPQLM